MRDWHTTINITTILAAASITITNAGETVITTVTIISSTTVAVTTTAAAVATI